MRFKETKTFPYQPFPFFTDLHWLVRGTSHVQFSKTLIESGVDNYIQLAKRIIPDNDTSESKVRVTKNGNLGVFVKIISNQFITDVDEKTDPNFTLRIMKSCFLSYYSVVALKKYSTYTQFFNEKIRMFVSVCIVYLLCFIKINCLQATGIWHNYALGIINRRSSKQFHATVFYTSD